MHHLGQFLILKIMDCPVENFDITWATTYMDYGTNFLY